MDTEIKADEVVEVAEPVIEEAVKETTPDDNEINDLLSLAVAKALENVSPTDKAAYVAKLNAVKEALTGKISQEKAKLKPQENSILEGKSPDEIIAMLPVLRVTLYDDDGRAVAAMPLSFVKSKSGEVGAVNSANAVFTAADGKIISAKVRAGIVIPVKSKKEKPAGAAVAKKKKAKV